MSWAELLLGGVGLLMFLIAIGLPVFSCFLIVNLAGLLLLIGMNGTGLFVDSLINTAGSISLAPIPLFLLMGEVLFRSGSVDVLFRSVDQLIGQLRGRLYFVTMALSTIFGALSGSAIAVAAMLGRSVYPGMVERGYSSKLSVGVILAGACLAPIIPPSILAVIIGSLADVSISKLLIAGIVPGLVIAGMTLVYVIIVSRRMGEDEPTEETTTEQPERSSGRAILEMLPFLIVIFSVMGLIILGIATPSEAAATGVTGALIVAVIYRKLTISLILDALASAARVSAAILLIVASSVLFSQLLAISGASTGLIRWITTQDMPDWALLLILMLVPLILCMFMDQVAFMLAAIPLYIPIVASLDVDPLWFWAMFAVNLTIGTITPPFGYTLFALSASGPKSLTTKLVYSGSWPVVGIMLLALVLFAFVPEIILWLPGLIGP